jgi:hypothetical protein
MTSAYEFDISRATRAGDLHALIADINADETLASDEKEELLKIIATKFAQWNRSAVVRQNPRWC